MTTSGLLEGFLNERGITIETRVAQDPSPSDYQTMSQMGTVSISIEPLNLYPVGGVPPPENPGGYHAMVVTGEGVDANGRRYLLVSSWGNQFWVYPDEYDPNNTNSPFHSNPRRAFVMEVVSYD
jgi:hypothetical protein